MRMLKKILCATLAMGLIGALGDDAFAQETKKKKKKKKKKAPPAGETTDTSGGEGKAAATEATESTETAATAWKAPYGAAGCGLGSIVLGNKPGIIQVFAATTNGTSASQSFGITTGTSNCVGPSSAAAAQIEREVYVDMNFASLSKEAAQGSGEHLTALADIMGCAGSAEDLAAFGRLSQNRYGDIFNAANSKDVATNYVNAVRAEPTLASRCVRAI